MENLNKIEELINLANAYEEMGDIEGAEEIRAEIEDVKNGYDAEQEWYISQFIR